MTSVYTLNTYIAVMVLLIQFLHASVYGSENGSISLQLSSYEPDFSEVDKILGEYDEGNLSEKSDLGGRLFELSVSIVEKPLVSKRSQGYRLSYLRHASNSTSGRYNSSVELLSGDLLLVENTRYFLGKKRIERQYGIGVFLLRMRQDINQTSALNGVLDQGGVFGGLHLSMGLNIPLSDHVDLTINSHFYKAYDVYIGGVGYDFDDICVSYGLNASL